MELRQLRIFATAAQLLNFTKTAQELDYAQSNVTAQIRQLEEELGVRLFERLGRSLQLTYEGGVLLRYAKKMLRLEEEALQRVAAGTEIAGRISIGAAESLCIYRLPPLIQEYRRLYPLVDIHLEVNSCHQFPHLLRTNSIDVAFTMTRPITLSDMHTDVLVDEPMAIVASPHYKLVHQCRQLRPHDLEGESLILTEKTCGYQPLIMKMLQDSGVTIGPLLEFTSLGAIKECVMIGLGVSIIPRIAVNQEIADGRLVDFSWEGPRLGVKTQLLYHREKWISPALQAFLDLSRQILGQSCAYSWQVPSHT